MVSFPGYTIVSNNTFQIHYNITITLTLNFPQQVDWLYNHVQIHVWTKTYLILIYNY